MEKIKKEYRFYENELPEEGDHVMVTIKEVNDYSIVVELLEYQNIEGMIILAEYSNPRRSRYNQGILLARKNINKKDVCYVLRVDKQKKNIDLSKKRIKREIAKEVEEKYQKGKKVQRMFYPLCKSLGKDIGYFYEKIVFPL